MKNNIRQIVLGVGIGDIKFGMSRDEVRKIAGDPDEIDNVPGIEEGVNNQLESWHYDENEFSLVFDADYDWRLVSIAVSDPYFIFEGKPIIGQSKQYITDLFDSLNIEVSNEEDLSDEESPDLILLESDESGIMVWFENNEVIEVQIVPDIEDDDETLIWPE